MANIINKTSGGTFNIIENINSLTNFTMIDGLTPDIIKRKYIWLLNAIVENAIIGQDEYGLVWYSGNWIAGEWEDGTWYSGIWYDGEWKNGKFYSYRFDVSQLLQRNKRILEKDNPIYSQFRHGIWRRGDFFNGYFGPQRDYEDWEFKSKIEILYYDIRWEDGTFYGGVFRNSAWIKGVFQNGIFYNSEWMNGTFMNGTFQGYMWWNGNFTGGDFVLGHWMDGNFNQGNPNIKSRFGSMPLTGTTMAGTSVYWYDGIFMNGEFHSGLNVISGITAVSDNHNRTVWLDGTWNNGTWYGGTHVAGKFNNGHWFEGFWSGGTFNDGYWYNGFWLSGEINGGFFIHGLFENMIFNGGQLGYQPPEYLLKREVAARSTLTNSPVFLAFAPTVITYGVNDATLTTASISCDVITDGGDFVLVRGVCFGFSQNPTLLGSHTSDGSGLGAYTSIISGLLPGTLYYARSYAANSVRTAYGNQVTFITL